MALPVTVVLGLFGLLIAYVVRRVVKGNGNGRPLPPGPKGLPILGNVNDMPKPGVLEAHHWLEHKDKYGQYMHGRFVLLMGTTTDPRATTQAQSVLSPFSARPWSSSTTPKLRSSFFATAPRYIPLDPTKTSVATRSAGSMRLP